MNAGQEAGAAYGIVPSAPSDIERVEADVSWAPTHAQRLPVEAGLGRCCILNATRVHW